MTGLIRMNAEQMRRKGLENAEAKRQREKDYINQMEKMSKPVVNKEDILVALRDIIEESEKDSMKMKQKKKDSI